VFNVDFIDLFAGIGGMRLGLEEAGGKCVFSSEIDRHAQDTYEANFGERPLGDIRDIGEGEIPFHDILLAGFPRQPFSIAGVSKLSSMGRKHGLIEETRGTLFYEITRILEYHRPKAFLLENVKGLLWHDKHRTFSKIIEILESMGYTTSHKVISSVNFVPQRRERVFIVGFRDGNTFEFPDPPNNKHTLASILEDEVDPKYTLNDHLWNYHQERKRMQREKGNGFGFRLFNREETSGTLSARYYKDGADLLLEQPGANPRRLTPRECARLMGFSDKFTLNESEVQAYRQLGNAVVPPVVAMISKAMVKQLQESAREETLLEN